MLQEARKDAGYSNADKLAVVLGFEGSTVRRAEAGDKCPGVMNALHKVLPDQAAAIVAEYSEYWQSNDRPQAAKAVGAGEIVPKASNSQRWLGVVKPNGRTRTYTSIDDVTLTITGKKVVADFTRLFPIRQDRGRTWRAQGKVSSNGELRMFFDPSGKGRREFDSSGCFLFVRRHLEATRLAYYKGLEIRGSETLGGREPDARECDLYPPDQLPSDYMPTFAVLDLDNTLFNDWSLIRWTEKSLHLHGFAGLDELRNSLLTGRDEYRASRITHDAFAIWATNAYADFFNRNDSTSVRQAASAFAGDPSTRECFHAFASELVRELRRLLIAPVLITGAPQELASELASAIGITEVYGFDLARPDQPNPGTADGKIQLARSIAEKTSRSLQFAAGDAESDALVLAAAPARLMSSLLLERRPDLTASGHVFEFDKETTTEAVTHWVREVMPDPILLSQA